MKEIITRLFVNARNNQRSVVLPKNLFIKNNKPIDPKFVKLKITIPKDYIGKVGDVD